MGAITTKTFRSGDGVAVMLPPQWGVGPDLDVTLDRDALIVQDTPDKNRSEAEKLRRFREMLRRLDELGPVGEIQDRSTIAIEFPDRPGLD